MRDVEEKAGLLQQANQAMRTVEVIADLVVGAALSTAGTRNSTSHRLASVSPQVSEVLALPIEQRQDALNSLSDRAAAWLNERRPHSSALRRPLHWLAAFPEVFLQGSGFSCFVGNPPFVTGQRIAAGSGSDYRDILVTDVAAGQRGSADLSAYFFLQANRLLAPAGTLGFLATNSVAQGTSREVGLDRLTNSGVTIFRSVKDCPWPGNAAVVISKIWLRKGPWGGPRVADGEPCDGIDGGLRPASPINWTPQPLAANRGLASEGSKLYGEGFVLSQEVAERLLADQRYAKVVRPFLGGSNLNEEPEHRATRWAIDFGGRSLEEARSYPAALEIVERLVKPVRDGDRNERTRTHWWQYERRREDLYAGIASLERVLAVAVTSKTLGFAFVPADQVFQNTVVVFKLDGFFDFGVLSSALHYIWVDGRSSMKTDLRYTPSKGFESFPRPEQCNGVAEIAETLYNARRNCMIEAQEGLTKTYNRLHDATDSSPGIVRLRELHRELDVAVLAAYGWSDINLEHDFVMTGQGVRWTVSLAARSLVLDRLLAENRRRYEAQAGATGAPSARHRTSVQASDGDRPTLPLEAM